MDYTNSTFEEVSAFVDGLLVISPDDLDAEAIRNQRIFSDISRIYIQKSRKLMAVTTQLDKLEHKRFRHYAGKETAAHYREDPLPEAILKSDIPSHMNIDPLLIEMRSIVRETEMTVKYLEECKGSLRSRGFDIKNAIEYRKLMMGG